ncbi:MAG: hypothetical protein GX957_03605 [Clostridiaceae bacterium]|nr:hypothetical protein [Clostridiaceae bacterium]
MTEYWNISNANYIRALKSNAYIKLFKLQALNHYENVMYDITSKLNDSSKGSINCNYNQGKRRTCSFSLIDNDNLYMPNNEDSLFFKSKKFKISLGIEYQNERFWFDEGVFIAKTVDKSDNIININGVDKFALFSNDMNQHKLQQKYIIPAGSTVGRVIEDIITIDMGNGYPTDPIKPIIAPQLYSLTIPYTVEKEQNSTLGDLLIDLATAVQCDIYYDGQGYLNLTKVITDDYLTYAPQWEFSEHQAGYNSASLSFDYGNCVNAITVRGTGEDYIYSHTAINDYPMSITRVSLIGFNYDDIVETPMGYDNQRCKEYAEYLLNKKTILALLTKFNGAFLPHLEENKLISIEDRKFGFNKEKFVIQEFVLPFGASDMTLSVANINDLPFTKERRLYE